MHSDATPLIAASHLWASYGSQPVLRNVSIEVRGAEMVALAGPNGSGKTTLLKVLSGVRKPDSGSVRLDGQDVRHVSPRVRARRLAVVSQGVEAHLMYRVRELVAMGRAPYHGYWRNETQQDRIAVRQALDATGIADLADRRFADLSGGEQQRVMLAMALAQESDLLLLDEPTVHLDLHYQAELLELLARLHLERGVGVLAVMHDLNLAGLYFDRLVVLQRGEIVAEGGAADVLRDQDSLAVFRAPLSIVDHPRAGVPQVLLDRPGSASTN